MEDIGATATNRGVSPQGWRKLARDSGGAANGPERDGKRPRSAARVAHVVTGPGGEFLAWSDTLSAMIGRETSAMPRTTRSWLELAHPEDRRRLRRVAIETARTGKGAELEYRLQRGPRDWLRLRHVMEPLVSEQDASGARRWLNTLQDVTEAKQAGPVLPASAEQYRATFEQAAVGIVHSSLEGELQLVNRAFCLMTGYPRAELARLHIRDLTHPADLESSMEGRRKLIQGDGAPYEREVRLRRKDGSYLWALVATSIVRATDGRPTHFVTVLSDISERKRAEEEVNRFRAAMDVTVDAIFLSNPQTMRLLYVNDTACRTLGYTREQLLQKPPWELLGRTREQLARENDAVIAAAERGIRTETRYVRSDGSGGWTELYRRALPTDSGVLIVTIARDVTERRAQQEKIERLNRVYAMLSGINAAIVHIRDRDELFRECCRIAHEAGGFDAVSIHLIDPQKLIAEPLAWHGRQEMMEWLRQGRFSVGVEKSAAQSLPVELIKTRRPATTNDALHDPRVQFKDALARFGINSVAFLPLIVSDRVTGVMTMYSPLKGHFDEAEIRLLSGLAADISFAVEHLEKSERATYLALYDELTGLANRQLLAERLGQFIHVARHAQARLALALLDIERLRSVNNSLGRRAGDALLRQVGERLARAAGATATARVASNHFAVVLPAVRDRPDAGRKMAALTRACFAEPYTVDGTELKVRARTGLVVFPTDGADTETLLVNAETALRKAKQTGERQVFYTPDLSERTAAWLPLETKLLGALEKDEFVLYYQPKVDTSTRRIVGLEALLRWKSADFGVVPPAKFIPLMEETGMILDVGAWALQRAALDHRSWIEQGLTPLRVAVNVSPVQLRQHDFVQAVAQAIQKGVTPSGIDLELTESLVMDDVEENIRKLNHVRDLGLRVAIDDFGTGYSSLGYLAKLPVQALKIDRSFIISLLTDSTARTLVQTINSLAHTLGLEVIAEGVEEEEQAKVLLLMHCDQIQGYLISRPVPFDEMTRLLRVSRLGNGTVR